MLSINKKDENDIEEFAIYAYGKEPSGVIRVLCYVWMCVKNMFLYVA